MSTKPGGTGLGLAVTQRLVQGFGWRLTMERCYETGETRFCIHIPSAALLTESPLALEGAT